MGRIGCQDVIPAQAGIQNLPAFLDSRLRGSDRLGAMASCFEKKIQVLEQPVLGLWFDILYLTGRCVVKEYPNREEK